MITQNDNGSEAMAIINAALEDAGFDVVIGNESGSSTSSKLNEVFGESVLTSALYGNEWVAEVNEGLENLNPPVPHDTLRLLHVSDCHGYTDALAQCQTLMQQDSGISHLLITGDMTQYSTNKYTSDTVTIVKAMSSQVLLATGNHDVYDNTHQDLGITRSGDKYVDEKRWQQLVMGNNVNWGSSATTGTYWYKDIATDGGHTLRVVCIDDYAPDGKEKNAKVFTEAMVNWLIGLLLNTPSSYHLLFMAHTPPFENQTAPDATATAMRPQNSTEANGQKLFTSELHERWYNVGLRDYNLMPRILHAYMHKESIDFTYTTNTATSSTFQVTADFSQNDPATVAGWACGHIHDDYCGYAPYTEQGWDDILLLGVTAANSSVLWSGYDDLLYGQTSSSSYGGTKWATSEPTYRINELIIDFTANTITVKRHGNKTTANVSGRSYGGRVRNQVMFPLER